MGDALHVMKDMPTGLVNCIVTSPPYWGLRDYGVPGQLGLERTPEEYVERLVGVFREAKRVLRDDGTLWLNLGDCYAVNGAKAHRPQTNTTTRNGIPVRMPRGATPSDARASVVATFRSGLKPKDLVGIPWRVAFALQADGWYLRSDIIWHKPNAMPESVKDRLTKAHEYIFLLSQKPDYFFDIDAIREPHSPGSMERSARGRRPGHKYTSARNTSARAQTFHTDMSKVCHPKGRNRRSVWTVSTRPFKGAHFATFPEKLVEPCLLAGCIKWGTVLDPFFGSGTVGVVAQRLHRRFIGIDLNPEYLALARNRIDGKLEK